MLFISDGVTLISTDFEQGIFDRSAVEKKLKKWLPKIQRKIWATA